MLSRIHRVLTPLVSLSLILPLVTINVAHAHNGNLTMVIGRPNIWSLGQAHYLLANLRDTDRGLSVAVPGLDPNSVNGARMNVLRTLLGAEAQLSTPQAVENRVAQQQFEADFSRKQQAITRLDELSRDYLQVIKEISDLDSGLASLGPKPAAKDQVAETELKRDELTKQKEAKVVLRDAIGAEITVVKERANKDVTLSNLKDALPLGTPGATTLPTDAISDIKPLIEKMLDKGIPNADASQRLDNYINMQYELIAKQLTLLRDQVSDDERLIFLELPSSLYTVPERDNDKMVHIEWTVSGFLKDCEGSGTRTVGTQEAQVLKETALEAQTWTATIMGKTPRNRQRPPISDAYLAKFFELVKNETYRSLLVHSIYAEAYNKLLHEQVEQKQELDTETTLVESQAADENKRMAMLQPYQAQSKQADLKVTNAKKQLASEEFNNRLSKLDKAGFKSPAYRTLGNTLLAQIEAYDNQVSETDKHNIKELSEMVLSYPELLTIGWTGSGNKTETSLLRTASEKAKTLSPENDAKKIRCGQGNASELAGFRVIDTVPRQSALNVNDVHATQNGFALAAKFLTLFGLGGQVSYQRQRSIYDQFINQEVFASGFGKGTDRFGWTIGPVPGTKRLAPGPRTTFAILAIPKAAWQITLQANAVSFPRTKDPDDQRASTVLTPNAQAVSFDLTVPGERTDTFQIKRIDYTPVPKGRRVTAILGGYFSPLTGVMVEGVPLKRAVAIAKHESPTTTLPVAADSPGEYEYLSSNQIVVSFTMSDANFIGTPLITLVTPEKTEAINFDDALINNSVTDSLQHHSLIEPIFLDTFQVTKLEVDPKDLLAAANTPIPVRLIGSGFRRGAEICINNDCAVAPTLKSPGLYEFTIAKPAEPVWTVTYRLGHELASKTFDTRVDGARLDAPTIDSIENPSTGKAEGLPSGGYTIIIRGNNLSEVNVVRFGKNKVTDDKIKLPRHPNVLLVDVPAGREGAVQVLLEGSVTIGGQTKYVSNILDFVTPGKAIFKYVKPEKPKPPTKPATRQRPATQTRAQP